MAQIGQAVTPEEARALREQGALLREIAEQAGVSVSTCARWIHPEKTRAENRRRRAYKTAWENANRATCPSCGGLMGAGSGRLTKGFLLCRRCHIEQEKARVAPRKAKIVKWWAEGLSLNQIAERLGWSRDHLGVEMFRMREAGFDLPYRRPRS